MKISLYPPLSIHEIGQRPNQEDSIAQWDNRLFVLCDGMGGHEKGEVASQTVCLSLVTWFKEHVNPDSPFTDDHLREALEYAYSELDKHDDDNPRKMGTTLTLLYINRCGVLAAHIGDSRIYHIRPYSSPMGGGQEGGILYQSRDHSLAFDLFQSGGISYDEMLHYPRKNIVTRAMTPGEENRMIADIIHITDVHPGDYFYMCSDGMLEQMSNKELFSIFSSEFSDTDKRLQLVQATSNNRDNHTAWLLHVSNLQSEEGDEYLVNEEPTARCNAINFIPKVETVSDDNDEDDVVVISTPPMQSSKRKFWIGVCAIGLLFILAVAVTCLLFFRSEEEPQQQSPTPTEQPSVLLKQEKDILEKDTCQYNTKNGSAEYKPQFDAPRGNGSSRNI